MDLRVYDNTITKSWASSLTLLELLRHRSSFLEPDNALVPFQPFSLLKKSLFTIFWSVSAVVMKSHTNSLFGLAKPSRSNDSQSPFQQSPNLSRYFDSRVCQLRFNHPNKRQSHQLVQNALSWNFVSHQSDHVLISEPLTDTDNQPEVSS